MALRACRECGKEISSKASICPHCGMKQSASTKTFVKIIGTVALIWFVLQVLAMGAGPIPNKDTSPGTGSVETTKEIFQTTASQLFLDYERNEVAADEKMKDKIIEVTGRVYSIDKNAFDSIVVRLMTENQFVHVAIHLDGNEIEKQKALALEKGKMVTFDCDRMTRILDSPNGNGCIFK